MLVIENPVFVRFRIVSSAGQSKMKPHCFTLIWCHCSEQHLNKEHLNNVEGLFGENSYLFPFSDHRLDRHVLVSVGKISL